MPSDTLTVDADGTLDLFAGPGGWEVGARMIGHDVTLGIEWDRHANATARAAGFCRLEADIALLDPRAIAPNGIRGLIGSPPCQAWSAAGNRLGEDDRGACHMLAETIAGGGFSVNHQWADPRSALVTEPLRWARDLEPEWIALEEVPAVLGLWQHFAEILTRMGYHAWTGILNAADYGVPQTRRRAFLIASRTRRVHPPMPTHSRGGDMLTEPWRTMAQALGWAITGAGWAYERPATTVVGSFYPDVIAAPGYRLTTSRQNEAGSVRVTVEDAGILQSFPPDYPWQGSRTKRFLQVGNAVPPLLASHVLRAAGANQ